MKPSLINFLIPLIGGLLIAPFLHGIVVMVSAAVVLCVLALLPVPAMRYREGVVRAKQLLFPVAIGIMLSLLYRTTPPSLPDACEMVVKVCEPPKVKPYGCTFVASVDSLNPLPEKLTRKPKIQVRLYDTSFVPNYGDQIRIWTRPKRVQSYKQANFDYATYLSRKGVYHICNVRATHYRVEDSADWGRKSLRVRASVLQRRLLHRFDNTALSESQQTIAQAMMLGWRNGLDSDTQQQFRAAGITHLLCVSGLHVGIIAYLVGACLKIMGRERRGRIIRGGVQLIAVWTMVFVTGMAPSTLRAGVMFSFFVVGDSFFDRPNALNTLAASAIVLLFCNPNLIYDVSFQLSFSAVAGILSIGVPLSNRLAINKTSMGFRVVNYVVQLMCVTTAAQLATLPFSLYHFHQFPTYFLIANMTIVPFAGVLLATMLALLLLCWWPWSTHILSTLLDLELRGVSAITRWVSGLPHSMIENIYFDLTMAVVMGALIVVFAKALQPIQKSDIA